MQGGSYILVNNIEDEENCARQTNIKYPDALGATWYSNETCWAEFGEFMTYSSSHRACRFQRNGSNSTDNIFFKKFEVLMICL